ncbi:hypothetical protein [Aliiglaciecola litoralis]|uniref:UDP-glucose/GDP-mannose dehydrogenase N-terminal domain-containing protein n=1 Tax=Aliiglaciecola litoralis TaxID=582857 RepID=A0ABP3WZW9_9ALTE
MKTEYQQTSKDWVGFNNTETIPNNDKIKQQLENLSVVGLGLTGTLLSLSFANNGHKVIVVDMDSRKVNCVNQNHSPIQDGEMESAMRKARFSRHLIATGDLHNAILQTDVTLVCIGHGSIETEALLSHSIHTICQQIGASLAMKSKYHLVVIHSNLKPMACENQVKPIIERWSNKRCGLDFGLCYLPLRVSHKNQHSPTKLHNSIIHGAYDNKSAQLAIRLFATLDIGLKSVGLNPH